MQGAGAAYRRRAGAGGLRVDAGAPVGKVAALVATAVAATDARVAAMTRHASAGNLLPTGGAREQLAQHVEAAMARRGLVRVRSLDRLVVDSSEI